MQQADRFLTDVPTASTLALSTTRRLTGHLHQCDTGMKYQASWIAIALLSIQQSALANTELCDETAPLLESGFYYEIDDVARISEQQRTMLRAFARSINGQWRGEESVAICKGRDPSAVAYDYSIDADISTSVRGVVRLAAEKAPLDRSITKTQTLWLTPETEPTGDRQRWHTLEFIDNNTLIYSHKYRARNAGRVALMPRKRTARLVHEVNKLSYRNNMLSIDRKLYVNGLIV